MKKEPVDQRQDQPAIAREIPSVCTHCGGPATVLNGAYYRSLRELSKLTLVEMGSICNVGFSQLARMERGAEKFQPKYAELYERLFERRRKAGEE